ncbi:MAG: hypothetical protein CUN55_05135 [Phototrophicales bacterium]|nr:MAG: hypothetical protein CUN55_05135 [Phototrophicales bacterium]
MKDRALRSLGDVIQRFPIMAKLLTTVYRMSLSRFTVGAVGVLFDEKDRVLLVEHRFHPDFPWGLPGGWIDGGEMPQNGVERELKEELNLRVYAIQPVMIWQSPLWKNHIDMAFWVDTFQPDDINDIQLSAELANYGWFGLDGLPHIEPNHQQVIMRAYAIKQATRIIQQGAQQP